MPQEHDGSVKPLTTENAVTTDGTLVKPQEPTLVHGSDTSLFLKTDEPYTVHRILAEKLVKKGEAYYPGEKNKKKSKKEEGLSDPD